MKRGDIRVRGAASFATPLLSNLFLIPAGFAQAERDDRHCGGPDRRRKIDRGDGSCFGGSERRDALSARAISDARLNDGHACPPYESRGSHPRRQLEFRKIESRRDGASDQRPVAGAFGRLPGMRRHDRLRHFAGGEIGSEPEAALAAVIGDLQGQRAAGVIVPDLDGIDAMPVRALAARQQEIDRGRTRAAVGVACADRETSRDNVRLPDAASVRAAR